MKSLKSQLLGRAALPAIARGHAFSLVGKIADKRVELSRAKAAVFRTPEQIAEAVGAAIASTAMTGEMTAVVEPGKVTILDPETSPDNPQAMLYAAGMFLDVDIKPLITNPRIVIKPRQCGKTDVGDVTA